MTARLFFIKLTIAVNGDLKFMPNFWTSEDDIGDDAALVAHELWHWAVEGYSRGRIYGPDSGKGHDTASHIMDLYDAF